MTAPTGKTLPPRITILLANSVKIRRSGFLLSSIDKKLGGFLQIYYGDSDAFLALIGTHNPHDEHLDVLAQSAQAVAQNVDVSPSRP